MRSLTILAFGLMKCSSGAAILVNCGIVVTASSPVSERKESALPSPSKTLPRRAVPFRRSFNSEGSR